MNVPTGQNGVAANGQEHPVQKTPELRIVLLADEFSLRVYGPVLRRMAVGLIDEVRELGLLAPQPSALLEYLPCPPVRILTESRRYLLEPTRFEAATTRQIFIPSPRWPVIDRLFPRGRIDRIAAALSAHKPTLLHAMGESQAGLARNLSYQLGIPYVVSLLSLDRVKVDISDPRCHGILPCNSTMSRRLRRDFPHLACRIHFVPIGTHVSEKTCVFSHEDYRPAVFCCCNLKKNYGHEHLIEALRLLGEMGHRPFLTFSGEGPLEPLLRRQADKAGLLPQIQFIPPVEKMMPMGDALKGLLSGGDIYVQTWPGRSWRTEVMEAMSVGMAVVAATGQRSDLIDDGKTALYFPFGDPVKLAQALKRLLEDHDFARQLARNAQAYIRRHFLASKMVARLVAAYRKALAIPAVYPATDEDE
jgi:glycosyltransferase involved in cell wall biosynthesis